MEYDPSILTIRDQIAADIRNFKEIHIFTDGSHTILEQNHKSGFGCFFQEINKCIFGKCLGTGGNNYAESFAIAVALDIAQIGQKIFIYSDSIGSINMLQYIISKTSKTLRQTINSPNRCLWQFIDTLIKTKFLDISCHYIKAHSGIHGNDMADLAAKQGNNSQLCQLNYMGNSPFPFTIENNNIEYDASIRSFFTNIAAINCAKKRANALQISNEQSVLIDWNTTKSLINLDGPIRAGFSTIKSSTLRSFVIKSQHNALPTHALLNEIWPTIYKADSCPFCFIREDSNHIWNCEKLSTQREEAISKIQDLCKPMMISASDITTLWQGFCTISLTQAIKALFITTKNSQCTAKSSQKKFSNFERSTLRKILEQGFDIWQFRNKIAIQYQKTLWNVKKQFKKPQHRKQQNKHQVQNNDLSSTCGNDNGTSTSHIQQLVSVHIDNNNLDNSLYFCNCGRSIYNFDHSQCSNLSNNFRHNNILCNMYFNNSFSSGMFLDPNLV